MSDIKYYSLKEVTGRDMTAEHYGVVLIDLFGNEQLRLVEQSGNGTAILDELDSLLLHRREIAGSGTESVMAAIRVARCATRKKRVIKVGGAYHGWSDQMEGKLLPRIVGPPACKKSVYLLPSIS